MEIFCLIMLYLALGSITAIPLSELNKLNYSSKNIYHGLATIFCWPIIWIALLFLFIIKAIRFSRIMLRTTYDLCKELFQVYK